MLRVLLYSASILAGFLTNVSTHYFIEYFDPPNEATSPGGDSCITICVDAKTGCVIQLSIKKFEELLKELDEMASPPDDIEVSFRELEDDQGRGGAGELFVLDQAYRWRLESTSTIEYADGTEVYSYQDRILAKPGIKARLERAKEVIALGVASCEGSERRESRRAADRAMHLAAWVNEVAPPHLTTYTLSLGRFNGECEGSARETSDQRRVVLLAIYERDPDLKINVAMWRELQELSQTGRLRLDPSMYGDFDYAEAL